MTPGSRRTASATMAAFLLLLAAILAGCADSAGRTFEHEGSPTVAPGRFAEVNLQLKAGDTIGWDWSADGALHFDIHTHLDGDVQLRVQEENRSSRGSYEAPQDGGYSFLWANRGQQPVALQYAVHGDGSIDSIV